LTYIPSSSIPEALPEHLAWASRPRTHLPPSTTNSGGANDGLLRGVIFKRSDHFIVLWIRFGEGVSFDQGNLSSMRLPVSWDFFKSRRTLPRREIYDRQSPTGPEGK
jgi:hypothetical protein